MLARLANLDSSARWSFLTTRVSFHDPQETLARETVRLRRTGLGDTSYWLAAMLLRTGTFLLQADPSQPSVYFLVSFISITESSGPAVDGASTAADDPEVLSICLWWNTLC